MQLITAFWKRLNMLKIKLIRAFFPNYIIRKSELLFANDESKIAVKILKQTLKFHPENYQINSLLGDFYREEQDWEKAILYYNSIIQGSNKRLSFDIYDSVLKCYKKLGSLPENEELLINKIYQLDDNAGLLKEYVSVAIGCREWKKTIKGLELLIENLKSTDQKMNYLIKLSMVYQVIGKPQDANVIFEDVLTNYQDVIMKDKEGYRKLIIFDNGESRIEFYKKLKKTDQVIVTFDSINMEWQNPSFAFKLLSRQNLDIIAVRKKKKQKYQQDLKQDDFLSAVNQLISPYKDKVAYGFSLGAYNALYFASLLDCRILAISPRLSIHPVYGRTKIIPKYDFKQNISLPSNSKIQPIIVFDPKNKLDNRYVKEEIIWNFPKAILIEIPYGGHGVAPHLVKTGQLKEFILNVLNNVIPKYNRKLRYKSPRYFRLLALECYRHNKYNWSLNIVNRSLELEADNKGAIKLKVQSLTALHRYEEALVYLKGLIDKDPNILTYRNLLIDTYIHMDSIRDAETELQVALKQFGERPSLNRRKKSLEKVQYQFK